MALLLALLPTVGSAHERRDIGPFQAVVGFAVEPALIGEPNGADIRLTNRATGQPVAGAEKTLRVEVAFGGGPPREFPLRARFGQPGAYTADLIPTRAGSYIFTFRGEVDGTPIEERFESGPGRFNDVESAERIQFPETAPDAGTLQRQVRAAEARADQSTALGYLGLGLGALGLAAGAVALLRTRVPRAGGQAA